MRNRFSLVILFFFAWAASPLFSEPTRSGGMSIGTIRHLPARLDAEHQMKLRARLDTALREIATAEERGDWESHASQTLALLQYTSRIPIHNLATTQSVLLDNVKRHGFAPFLSYSLDYASRLARVRTPWGRRLYLQLASIFRYEKNRMASKRPLFIRSASRRSFRRYSDNVGWAVSTLYFSSFGAEMIDNGLSASNAYLRAVALLDGCRRREESRQNSSSNRETTVSRPDLCELFVNAFTKADGQTGTGPAAIDDARTAITDLAGTGFMSGVRECITGLANDKGVEMVDRLEDYLSCRNANGTKRTPPDPSWFIGMVAEGDVFRKYENAEGDIIGSTWEFPRGDGGKISEGHFQAVKETGNDPERDRFVGDAYQHVETDGNGKVVEYHYEFNGTNAQGQHLSESHDITVDENGGTHESYSVEMEGVGSFSTSTDTAPDGSSTTTTTTTIEYDDGSSETWTTTTTTSANGQKTTTTTHSQTPAPSTPVDEAVSDPCRNILSPDLRQPGTLTKLDLVSIPAIDAPSGSTVLDQCMVSGTTLSKCTSVWLCSEGTVDANCRCSVRKPGSLKPDFAARCQAMMCSEGASCDPATGTCRSTGSAGIAEYTPGVGPLPDPDGMMHGGGSIQETIVFRSMLGELRKQRDTLGRQLIR